MNRILKYTKNASVDIDARLPEWRHARFQTIEWCRGSYGSGERQCRPGQLGEPVSAMGRHLMPAGYAVAIAQHWVQDDRPEESGPIRLRRSYRVTVL